MKSLRSRRDVLNRLRSALGAGVESSNRIEDDDTSIVAHAKSAGVGVENAIQGILFFRRRRFFAAAIRSGECDGTYWGRQTLEKRFETEALPAEFEIRDLLERHGDPAWLGDLPPSGLDGLIEECVRLGVHAADNPVDALQELSMSFRQIRRLAAGASPAQLEELRVLETMLRDRREARSEVELQIQDIKLQHAHDRIAFLERHGSAALDLQAARYRMSLGSTRLRIRREHATWSKQQVEAAAARDPGLMAARRLLESLRLEAASAASCMASRVRTPDGRTVSNEELAVYNDRRREAMGRVLQASEPLTHRPRATASEPARDLVSLEARMQGVLEVKPDDLRTRKGTIGSEYKSLSLLEEAAQTIRATLARSGLDVAGAAAGAATTLAERTAQLQGNLERTEADLEDSRKRLRALESDEETTRIRATLNIQDDAGRERIDTELRSQARDATAEASKIEAEIATLTPRRVVRRKRR